MSGFGCMSTGHLAALQRLGAGGIYSGGVYQKFHDYANANPYKPELKWKRLTKEQRMDERLLRRRKAIRARWMNRIACWLGIAAAVPVVIAGLSLLWRMAIWSAL